MQKHKGNTMIITLSGPSGAGKSTVLRLLVSQLRNFKPLVSITTRPPRNSDVEGEYEYVDDTEFNRWEELGQFAWVAEPHKSPYRYGTLKSSIAQALADTREVSVGVLVPEKVFELLATWAADKPTLVIPVYLWINDKEELRRRLVERGDTSEESITKRLASMNEENALAEALAVHFFEVDASQAPRTVSSQILWNYHSRHR